MKGAATNRMLVQLSEDELVALITSPEIMDRLAEALMAKFRDAQKDSRPPHATVAEAARILRISDRQVRRRISAKLIRASKTGSEDHARVLIPYTELDRIIAGRP